MAKRAASVAVSWYALTWLKLLCPHVDGLGCMLAHSPLPGGGLSSRIPRSCSH